MTAKTWIGGKGGNQASFAANWSSNSAPLPGDTLTIDHGTLNVTGSPIGLDELYVTGNAKISLRDSASDHLTIGVPGSGTINATVSLNNTGDIHIAQGYSNLTINASGLNGLDLHTIPGRGVQGNVEVHNSGTIIGTLSNWGETVRVDGGTIYNQTGSSAGRDGNRTIINSKVIGFGSWSVGTYHAPQGGLEFMQSVGEEQTVIMEPSLGYATLRIDQPSTFKAAIEWQNDGAVIDLVKLAADSYKYDPTTGALDFFRGNRLVDELRIDQGPSLPSGYTVGQGTSTGGAGIEIYSTDLAWKIPHGATLPVHV
jgi:hypothetical protein